MGADSNEKLVRTMVEAFQRGDLDTVGASFAADAVWDLPGRGVLAGTYTGPEEIVGFLARSYEMSGGTLAIDLIDVLSSEHGAAHVQRVTAHRDGRTLDCIETLAHTIVDGRITTTHHRPDAHAIDEFFG